uniref:Uncharacterized protein n=1 Tax=Panagrolaimus davidi TaxID=227884 RepID=A0A914PD38_9BILA
MCDHTEHQKECSNDLNLKVCSSCVAYLCPDSADGTGYRTGCPEDFFEQCSTHKNDIHFIKRQNYNDLEHMNLKDEVIYISGCAEESVGVTCILAKVWF